MQSEREMLHHSSRAVRIQGALELGRRGLDQRQSEVDTGRPICGKLRHSGGLLSRVGDAGEPAEHGNLGSNAREGFRQCGGFQPAAPTPVCSTSAPATSTPLRSAVCSTAFTASAVSVARRIIGRTRRLASFLQVGGQRTAERDADLLGAGSQQRNVCAQSELLGFGFGSHRHQFVQHVGWSERSWHANYKKTWCGVRSLCNLRDAVHALYKSRWNSGDKAGVEECLSPALQSAGDSNSLPRPLGVCLGRGSAGGYQALQAASSKFFKLYLRRFVGRRKTVMLWNESAGERVRRCGKQVRSPMVRAHVLAKESFGDEFLGSASQGRQQQRVLLRNQRRAGLDLYADGKWRDQVAFAY
jgi:hypothetical protein